MGTEMRLVDPTDYCPSQLPGKRTVRRYPQGRPGQGANNETYIRYTARHDEEQDP